MAEKSQYKLKLTHNGVNWYSWGGEAFNKTKLENKHIFGFGKVVILSTCHWFHVMVSQYK
ncbi:DUF255 domain-containing protein [Peribacillus frigoritolerans]|uniref:DUF255 domain-containing protein n=1 Tax=Peribacillus frigoritolerans TaxID=450367 RepID=UPI003F83202A